MKFITLFLLLFTFPMLDDNLSNLQGDWISEDDGYSIVHVNKDQWIFQYNDSYASEDVYKVEIKNEIPMYSGFKSEYLVLSNKFDTIYYEINAIGEKQMSLTFLPRGNTLIYIRK